MQITFRCDASIKIGTGHVMRCLALARGLREAGARCRFITRALPGHLGTRIEAEGFDLVLLPSPIGLTLKGCFAHVEWSQDAAETKAALDPVPDWLVVDHYSFDSRWQEVALPREARLMVIDDLANRFHCCDLLLDQNLGRTNLDYDGLVPDDCIRLIGPQFALLRPEFAERRAEALVGRDKCGIRRLLITMGGTDPNDSTSDVLDALRSARLSEDARIAVIMGSNAPGLERVRARATEMPWPTDVLVDVEEMAVQMAAADFAIAAGGSTTWERCVLGLPSIIVQIADNQAGIAKAMFEAGAALDPGPITDNDFSSRLCKALEEAKVQLEELGQRSSLICDGDGVSRVVAAMVPTTLGFRPANASDARRIWEWRATSDLQKYSLSGKVAPFEDHQAWFIRALCDPNRVFRILVKGSWPCGYIRLDRSDDSRARISICLAPDARGTGLAKYLLGEALRLGANWGIDHFDAEIHSENAASLRCFEQAGFVSRVEADIGNFKAYTLTLGEGI